MKEKKIMIIAMIHGEKVQEELMISKMMTITVTTKCTKVKMTWNIKMKHGSEYDEETRRRKI
jgi:hypothetical protein